MALLLVEWGLLPGPILDFSDYIERRRQEYYARLLAVSTAGDWVGVAHLLPRGHRKPGARRAASRTVLRELHDDHRVLADEIVRVVNGEGRANSAG